MQVFRDILVMPTQGLRNGIGRPEQRGLGGFYRGGPIWPLFHSRVLSRQCRGLVPFPIDAKPVRRAVRGESVRTLPRGVWCGPVSPHFGHMISDFVSRIARSIDETDAPLVFSLGPDVSCEPPPFFAQILEHFGGRGREVALVREPTRFEQLAVFAQEERAWGGRPAPRYLDLLDRLCDRPSLRIAPIDTLFVSRAGMPDGKLVGEGYLGQVLARLGVTVIHPEAMSLEAQLAHYRAARAIVASEGSALHGMQLLGRFEADVVVLVRRRGERLARHALAARARSLRYWNLITGLIHGVSSVGRPQLDRALALFDAGALAAHLRTIGLDIGPLWDEAAFAEAARAEMLRFVWYNRQVDLHPDSLPTIQNCLDANGIDLDVSAPFPAPH